MKGQNLKKKTKRVPVALGELVTEVEGEPVGKRRALGVLRDRINERDRQLEWSLFKRENRHRGNNGQ